MESVEGNILGEPETDKCAILLVIRVALVGVQEGSTRQPSQVIDPRKGDKNPRRLSTPGDFSTHEIDFIVSYISYQRQFTPLHDCYVFLVCLYGPCCFSL